MCVKFYFRDFNPDLFLSHLTNTCIYEVTIAWWSVQLTFQGKIQIWSWSNKLLWLMFDIIFFFFFFLKEEISSVLVLNRTLFYLCRLPNSVMDYY